MKGDFSTIVLKMALFLLVANLLMLFVVPVGAPEWYITVVSVALMSVLIAVIKIVAVVKGKKKHEE